MLVYDRMPKHFCFSRHFSAETRAENVSAKFSCIGALAETPCIGQNKHPISAKTPF